MMQIFPGTTSSSVYFYNDSEFIKRDTLGQKTALIIKDKYIKKYGNPNISLTSIGLTIADCYCQIAYFHFINLAHLLLKLRETPIYESLYEHINSYSNGGVNGMSLNEFIDYSVQGRYYTYNDLKELVWVISCSGEAEEIYKILLTEDPAVTLCSASQVNLSSYIRDVTSDKSYYIMSGIHYTNYFGAREINYSDCIFEKEIDLLNKIEQTNGTFDIVESNFL